MLLNCPFCVKEVYALRDAMRAGASHYSYTSSIHDLFLQRYRFRTLKTNIFCFFSQKGAKHLPLLSYLLHDISTGFCK